MRETETETSIESLVGKNIVAVLSRCQTLIVYVMNLAVISFSNCIRFAKRVVADYCVLIFTQLVNGCT